MNDLRILIMVDCSQPSYIGPRGARHGYQVDLQQWFRVYSVMPVKIKDMDSFGVCFLKNYRKKIEIEEK